MVTVPKAPLKRMIVADEIKDTLIARANRIMALDSITIAAFRQHVATLERQILSYVDLAATKDEQIKLYALNEKVLRKQIRRAKAGQVLTSLSGILLVAAVLILK